MNRGLRVGRIFGINIHIDASWILIFLLVTWSLASGLFPSWRPEWGTGLNWAVALAASLLFFCSILLHELSHSVVARARGLPVRRITLFLFGGVSNIEREPPTPKTEFLMAVVGPLTSILLGIFFLTLASLGVTSPERMMENPRQVMTELGPFATLMLWLGPVNIFLGIFNLLPGFPLDGGRILRAILWKTTGSLQQATRWASGVGRVTGWLLILTGIAMVFGVRVPIFGTGLVSGLWLVFIGWFLSDAAVTSYQQTIIRDLLEDVPVYRLMRADVPTVSPALPISALVYDYVMGTDEHAFPVVENDQMIGLVCLEDIRRVPRDQWEQLTVGDIMTRASQLDVVAAREDASDALEKLTRRDVRQIPVVDNGRLVGLLRRRDILRWLNVQSRVALPGH